jgi:hypothetical protein
VAVQEVDDGLPKPRRRGEWLYKDHAAVCCLDKEMLVENVVQKVNKDFSQLGRGSLLLWVVHSDCGGQRRGKDSVSSVLAGYSVGLRFNAWGPHP